MSQHVERKKTCALHSHGDDCTVCVQITVLNVLV